MPLAAAMPFATVIPLAAVVLLAAVACTPRSAAVASNVGAGSSSSVEPQGSAQPSLQNIEQAVKACQPLSIAPLSYDEQVARLKALDYARCRNSGDQQLCELPGEDGLLDRNTVVFDHKQRSARAVSSPEAWWFLDSSAEEYSLWFRTCGPTLQAHDPATLRELWRFDLGMMSLGTVTPASDLIAFKLTGGDEPACKFVTVHKGDGTIAWQSEVLHGSLNCVAASLAPSGNVGLLRWWEETPEREGGTEKIREVFVNLATGQRYFEKTTTVPQYGRRLHRFFDHLLLRWQVEDYAPTALTPEARTISAHALTDGQLRWSYVACQNPSVECRIQVDSFEGRPVVHHGDGIQAELTLLDPETGTPLWSRSLPLGNLEAVHKADSRWVFGAATPCFSSTCLPPSAYRVLDMTSGALLHETKLGAAKLNYFEIGNTSAALQDQHIALFLPQGGSSEHVAIYELGQQTPQWTTPAAPCFLGSAQQLFFDEEQLHVCGCDNVLRSFDLRTHKQLLRLGVESCDRVTLEKSALYYDEAPLAAKPWVKASRSVRIQGETCVDGSPNEYSGYLQVGDQRVRAALGPFSASSTLPGYITVQAVPTHTDLEWDSFVVGPEETRVDAGHVCVGHFHP